MVPFSDMQKEMETELDELTLEEGMDDTAEDDSVLSIYEVGYHFLPDLSEEALTTAVAALQKLLADNGASVVGERPPVKIPLAYTLTKRLAGKILRFDEANFGWVAFEMPRENIAHIKESLDANASVLRYLIVKTDRDEVAAALSGAVAHLPTVHATGDIGKPKRENEVGGEVSEVALDQALETIATEDAATPE
jgi:ribosomal protein S6